MPLPDLYPNEQHLLDCLQPGADCTSLGLAQMSCAVVLVAATRGLGPEAIDPLLELVGAIHEKQGMIELTCVIIKHMQDNGHQPAKLYDVLRNQVQKDMKSLRSDLLKRYELVLQCPRKGVLKN
jgi:hypothetical protein